MANQRLEAFINDCARVRAAIIKHLMAIHTTKQALKAEHAEIHDRRIEPALQKLRMARQALKGTGDTYIHSMWSSSYSDAA